MKHILSVVAIFATIQASAQQVNPVPDYVFRNQMSVGRNAVTDTAAYFSIGPRYGATKGFMPPIVGDTATFSSGKRNGLLIFSVQKNKFLYWDSVRVQWSDMAGSSGAYIVAGDTATMLAPYLRKADTLTLSNRINLKLNATDTASLSNRINLKLNISDTASMLSPYYRSAAATAALALKLNISDTSTMLSPYLRKADTTAMLSPYYRSATASAALALKLNISDTSTMLGNYVRHAGYGLTKSGQGFLVDTLNISTRAWRQKGIDSVRALISAGTIGGSGTTNYVPKFTAGTTIGNSQIFDNGTNVGIGTASPTQALSIVRGAGLIGGISFRGNGNAEASEFFVGQGSQGAAFLAQRANSDLSISTNNTSRLYIFANGRIGVNTTTDAGYQFDINGTLRSVNGANFATTSGNVGIGTTSPQRRLSVNVPFATNGEITYLLSGQTGTTPLVEITAIAENTATAATAMGFYTYTANGASSTEKMRLTNNGELLINTTSDLGDYKLQVSGNIYNTGSAVLAATSGNVGIGTASPAQTLHANATTGAYLQLSRTAQGGTTSPFGGIYFGDGTTFQEAAILSGADGNVVSGNMAFYTRAAAGSLLEAFRANSTQELLVSGISDAGDYKLQVSGNIYNTGSAVLAATSGNVGIGVSNPDGELELLGGTLTAGTVGTYALLLGNGTRQLMSLGTDASYGYIQTWGARSLNLNSQGNNTIINSGSGEVLIGTTSDAGDYKLQVSGNARIGTGKLDIASNTTFGLGVARSGTSEVAGQIYNSNGILYLGAESSAGGQIFTGSSAYAAVIGSGANYPLQFATNNATRATINTNGELLINTTSDQGDYKLQVNGSVYNTGQVTRGVINVQGTGGQVFVDSTSNLSSFAAFQTLSGSNASALFSGNVTWNTTGNPNAIDVYVTNTASGANANFINVGDGTNNFKVTKDAGIITGNPTSGTATKWKLGSVVATSVQLDTANYVEVEINGTFYRLAIVTPL